MSNKGKWMYNTGDKEHWDCEDGEYDTKKQAIEAGKEFFKNPSDEYLDNMDID
ncbi:UNVERIFIED_CONTAM: hypothetical protein ABIC26_002663 [Paenibacillus sp. PvR008]